MGLCGCCGSDTITKKNIDTVDYFELCDPCKNDYDLVADELCIDFVEDEDFKIPEFWKDDKK